MQTPNGELFPWYQLETCRGSQDVAIGNRTFDVYPMAADGTPDSGACADPYTQAAEQRIMIVESDGVRKGVSLRQPKGSAANGRRARASARPALQDTPRTL